MISGVGDVFVMRMYYWEHGDYEMNNHVVEYELDRRIGWEPEAGRGHPDTAVPPASPPAPAQTPSPDAASSRKARWAPLEL